MKIEKFNEDYDPNDGFDYPYGGHTFVLARYKKGWNNFKDSDKVHFEYTLYDGNGDIIEDEDAFDKYVEDKKKYNL